MIIVCPYCGTKYTVNNLINDCPKCGAPYITTGIGWTWV